IIRRTSGTPAAHHALAGERVLLIDDNEVNLHILREQLGRHGIEVETAASAAEALALLQDRAGSDRPFTLAILDFQMPAMDGLELGQQIRTLLGGQAPPLIMLTSFTARGHAEEAIRQGFAGYLPKPVKESRLLA